MTGQATTANFQGHAERDCGEHRTAGTHRAWCYDCSQWCYPGEDGACRGCELPALRARCQQLHVRNEYIRATFAACAEAIGAARRSDSMPEDIRAIIAERDTLRALLTAIEALCDEAENQSEPGFADVRASDIRAALAAASGAAPDKPAPTECNDERCVLPGAHDLGEFGCLVDPGVAPEQPNGDER